MLTKNALRKRLKETRLTLGNSDIAAARAVIADTVLEWTQNAGLPAGARVAAYEPMRTEPGSVELLAALTQRGFEVIVPITLPDNDLDWRVWSPAEASGTPPALGVDAIGTAALVLVPAFAVDESGRRLGRGGGSYDRALGRVAPGIVVAALLYDGEVVEAVPVDEWDVPVTAVATPSGFRLLGGVTDPGATGLRNG